MGAFSIASLLAGGALIGGLAFDVAVNAMQDWYQVVYTDALWASRVTDAPALRELALEEARINELLRNSQDFADRRVVIPPLANPGAGSR